MVYPIGTHGPGPVRLPCMDLGPFNAPPPTTLERPGRGPRPCTISPMTDATGAAAPKPTILRRQRNDFPGWYQDVVAKAELAENGPVRGTMVIRPYGYALWERLQQELDLRIKATGAQNAYFPLLIPESYLHREAQHVAGFSPELAVVTHGGGKKLEEPVVVRPTSETIINGCFARWIHGHRDLPLLINQWANVVRWELRPRLFLRTTEFLWQEGHTAHASEQEAHVYALRILTEVYQDTVEKELAIPVVTGRKTDKERFAGAVTTWTCESMMRDGKALQMGTSHELGQNFAKAFDITFTDSTGQQRHVWQTSWGASTRLIGALVMAHGDDAGLRIPPRIAPVQAVVILVRGEGDSADRAEAITSDLVRAGVRAILDRRIGIPFGRRSIEWELKGIPVRLEVGPRELAAGQVSLVERHCSRKTSIPLASAIGSVSSALATAQELLFDEARERMTERIVVASDVETALEATQAGFAKMPASQLTDGGEEWLNARGASVRCLLPDETGAVQSIVARAY